MRENIVRIQRLENKVEALEAMVKKLIHELDVLTRRFNSHLESELLVQSCYFITLGGNALL